MDKNLFRKKCLKILRKSSKNPNKIYKDKIVSQKVKQIIDNFQVKNILFYLPLELEVNLVNLLKHYRKNKNIFLPFIEEKSFKMVKYRLPLRKNCFNILEPKNSFLKIKKIDIMIVPVIGVDGNFKRVGFGKGMYDRFFQTLKNKPIVIFVQRQKCYTKEILTDWYDISCDFYITPK